MLQVFLGLAAVLILIGALLVAGRGSGTVGAVVGFLAVVLATVNVVGGFMVTDRMLRMFKKDRNQP